MIYKILSSSAIAPRYCFANPMILDFVPNNIVGLAILVHGNSKYSIMQLYTSWLRRSFGFESALGGRGRGPWRGSGWWYLLQAGYRTAFRRYHHPEPHRGPLPLRLGRSQNHDRLVKTCIISQDTNFEKSDISAALTNFFLLYHFACSDDRSLLFL